MSAKLNLSTGVDKFCRRRVFFSSGKLLKPSRLLNTINFRLLSKKKEKKRKKGKEKSEVE
jgi:hypothetical protein